jgi:hypothetical protein
MALMGAYNMILAAAKEQAGTSDASDETMAPRRWAKMKKI